MPKPLWSGYEGGSKEINNGRLRAPVHEKNSSSFRVPQTVPRSYVVLRIHEQNKNEQKSIFTQFLGAAPHEYSTMLGMPPPPDAVYCDVEYI